MKGKWPYVILLTCLVAFGYLFLLNPNQVSFRLFRGPPVRTNLALVIFLAFLSGFGAAFLTGLGQEAFVSLRFWGHRKREERREKGRSFFRAGRGHLAEGRSGAALRVLRKAYRRLPGDPAVALDLARAEAAQGRVTAAETRLKALLQDDPRNPEALSVLLGLQRSRGEVEGQQATLGLWLEADPAHTPSLRSLRELYRQEGQWLEAARVQEKVLARSEGREARGRERRVLSELLVLGARALPAAKAVAQLKRVVSDDGDFAAGYDALGRALAAAGDQDAACRVWLKGYEATAQVGLLLEAEQERVRQGRADEMLKLYGKIGKREGLGELLRARLLISLHRAEEALGLLEKMQGSVARTSAAAWLEGEALFRLRSFDRAARAYRRSQGAEDGAIAVPFSCRSCGVSTGGWNSTCPGCGAFDSLALSLGANESAASLSGSA